MVPVFQCSHNLKESLAKTEASLVENWQLLFKKSFSFLDPARQPSSTGIFFARLKCYMVNFSTITSPALLYVSLCIINSSWLESKEQSLDFFSWINFRNHKSVQWGRDNGNPAGTFGEKLVLYRAKPRNDAFFQSIIYLCGFQCKWHYSRYIYWITFYL